MENIAIVGLGNLGDKYSKTRHNIGFILVDFLAYYFGYSSFKSDFKFLISDKILFDKKVFLIKPQTYMNLSGEAVIAFMNFYKVSADNIIVIQDDKDIAFGKIKYKTLSSDGGHNGIKDIQNRIGKNIHRIKFGVGQPIENQDTASFVLSNFTNSELTDIENINYNIAKHFNYLIDKDFIKFINNLNSRE